MMSPTLARSVSPAGKRIRYKETCNDTNIQENTLILLTDCHQSVLLDHQQLCQHPHVLLCLQHSTVEGGEHQEELP